MSEKTLRETMTELATMAEAEVRTPWMVDLEPRAKLLDLLDLQLRRVDAVEPSARWRAMPMDLEDIQRRLTRAMAANAEAALLAMHGFPRNDAVRHLCLVAGNELQEAMRIVTQTIDCHAHTVETT